MIAVAGATGALGTQIVDRLIKRGKAVRALARTTSAPDRVAALAAMGATVVRGDLKDHASLMALCKGARAVISTVSIIVTAQPGDSFSDTDAAGTKALIDAAKTAGVEHFVFISVDTSDPHLSPESPLSSAKREVEEYLRASGMVYTILQPSVFMEVWLGPMLFADLQANTAKVYGPGTHAVSYVATGDVADVAVHALDTPDARNKTIAFGGPEDITQRDAVRLFEEALGRPLTVVEIPEQALEAQWSGAQNPFERTFAGLMLGFARGFGKFPPPEKALAPNMTGVRDYVRKTLAPSP